ncbi:hypothetical protein HG536_0E00820 [Torulaspora globosa]|uniref:VHS domain-containing protein n=1 Tax=Torulaspora globosa TaxID=48254 RepID=A0A7G3ZI35_9SACH|nr:uncharacterized protein HG536_0E00820 [Torulaspora globosa]QLL33171.1 hypothetical protein HG536_0E00820 [Torulaspora globosa]
MSQGIYLTDAPVRRPQPVGNPLLRKVQTACRLSLPEPDLALNLDVADYINEKQGPCPRDAVIAIVKLINSRDTHTAVFALALLDVLVKNCGYPLHLQISRKEFLNELVKRFPEHPPMRYSKVQRLILTAIEEWYQTICKHAAYKEDLGYIRDMHRLLKYKGYVFPKINESDLAVLRPSDHLKTPSEIQKEQEVAQAAKLEELIRRGRPEDLREANKLMKVMAGFKQDNANEAKQTISNELNKLKRKADLLNEMLSSSDSVDLQDDTIVSLYSNLKGAQPKFQKIIEEEHEDDNMVQDLLKFNDTVNQLLEKFDLLKAGDSSAASQIHPSNIAPSSDSDGTSNAGNGGTLAKEINLIDFDDDEETQSSSPQPAQSGSGDVVADLLSDLTDLSISSNSASQSFGLGGSISLGAGQPTSAVSNTSNANSLDLDFLSGFSAQNSASSVSNSGQQKIDDFKLLADFGDSSSSASSATKVLASETKNLKIEFDIKRESDSTIELKTCFSNVSSFTITDLTFLVAVPKSMGLRLQPQSGSSLSAFASNAVTQQAWIDNASAGATKPLKIKWKATYKINGSPVEETAVFTLPKL